MPAEPALPTDPPDDGAVVGGEPILRLPPWTWQLGIAAWSFVGVVVVALVVVHALAAVSEVTLPLGLAALLAIGVKPWADRLRHRLSPGLAAGGVSVGLVVAAGVVAVAAVVGVIDQSSRIDLEVDRAVERLGDELEPVGADPATVDDSADDVVAAVRALVPLIGAGLLTGLVAGVGTLVGFASGVVLGVLIMYYLVKDGTRLRRSVVEQFAPPLRDQVDAFIGEVCDVLRHYWAGRTVLSVIVAAVIGVSCLLLGLPLVLTIAVVNFVGGYVPYVGAFVGGALAVVVALGSSGPPAALLMLAIVLIANLALENLVEPKVMGGRLALHPVVVLVVTAMGGVIGGIAGLVLAVPATAITLRLLDRLRSAGVFNQVAASIEIIRRG
jgi:predicted PurR-regulated permease PerM